MAGLSFADDVTVTPNTPLLPIFLEWVTRLSADKSPATVRAYVQDCLGLATVLLEVVGRAAPSGPLAVRTPPPGVSADVFSRAVRAVGELTLGDLHPQHMADMLARYSIAPSGQRRAPATRRRAAAAWTTLCEYATRRGLLAANPMRDARIEAGPRPAHSPAPFEMSEARALLDVLATADVARTSRKPWPARDLALAAVLLTAGIRLSEACGARILDVRDRDEAPHLHVLGKGSKFRTVPLARSTTDVLETYLAERTQRFGEPQREDALFVRSDGRPFTSRALQHLVYRWYARAGITPHGRTCVHALRHTFATHLVNSSASIVEVKELLGHESLETTRKYLRSVGHGLRDAIEANPGVDLVRHAAGR